MPLPEEQQRLNELNRVIRDPGFSGLGPADQLDVFKNHLVDRDPGFAGLSHTDQLDVATNLLREMRPGWGETAADVATIVPVVGGAIHGYRSAQAGEPARPVTEAIFGPTEDPTTRATQEALRDVGEMILTGGAALGLVRGVAGKVAAPLAEGVAGALAKTGAEAATTAAAEVGKRAVVRKYTELLATDVTSGVMMGGIAAMERGEVRPFEDFIETPIGVGMLSIGFMGLGRAAAKFGQFRTQRILKGIEGANDPSFAKFLNEDGPAFVNAVRSHTGLSTEEAATFAEKVATQPVYGDEAKVIRGLLKAKPELLRTEVGQHILRMQRDAVLRTEVRFNDKPLTIHYEPTVDAPEFGFQKRWDKTETDLSPERFQQLVDAHKAGMIHIQDIEGRFNDVSKFGDLVRDPLDPAGKLHETPTYLLPGRTPGGKEVFLDPTKTPEAIPDLPDFYQAPRATGLVDEFGRPIEVPGQPFQAGLPALRPTVPQTADDFARVWEKVMMEADLLTGRTPRQVVDLLDQTPYAREHADKTISRLAHAQKEVDDELEILAHTHAYLQEGVKPEVTPAEVSPTSEAAGRYTKQFTGGAFDIEPEVLKEFVEKNRVTPADLAQMEGRKPLRGHKFTNIAGVTPAMEQVVNRYKKQGPPKNLSKQLKQAFTDAEIPLNATDIKGSLEDLVTKVETLRKKADSEAVFAADQMVGEWSRSEALQILGLTDDDYARSVIERAGYSVDANTGQIVNTNTIAARPDVMPLPPISMLIDKAVELRPRKIAGYLGTDIAAVGPKGTIETLTPKTRDPKTGRWVAAKDGLTPDEIEFVMRNTPHPFTSPGARLTPGEKITLQGPLTGGPGEQVTVVSVGLDNGVTVRYDNGDQLFALLDQSGNLKIQKALLKRAQTQNMQLKLARLRQVAAEREIKPGQEIYIMSPDKTNPDFLYRITKVEGSDIHMVGGISEEPVTVPIVNILTALEDGDVKLAEWIHPENRARSKRAKVGIGAEFEDTTFSMLHKTGTTERGHARGTFDDFVGMMEEELEHKFASDVRNLEPRQRYNLAGPMYTMKKKVVVDVKSPELAFKEATQFEPVVDWVLAKGEKGHKARRRMGMGMTNIINEELALREEAYARMGDYLDHEVVGLEGSGKASASPPGAKADALQENAARGKRQPSKKCPGGSTPATDVMNAFTIENLKKII